MDSWVCFYELQLFDGCEGQNIIHPFQGYSWGTRMSYHTSPIPQLPGMLFQLPVSTHSRVL